MLFSKLYGEFFREIDESERICFHGTFSFLQVLRDNEWSNQRRATEKKVATLKANETKPEEEKVQCKPLSQLDEIVLDILGKGNVRILTALTMLQKLSKFEVKATRCGHFEN